MQGLILVTWEKFLAARFGEMFVTKYRANIGQLSHQAPLAGRVYEDALFFTGLTAASNLSGKPSNHLLRLYGRYFLTNALTNHLCAYLLSRAHNTRDLILIMGKAHAQMRQGPESLMPPLFRYGAQSEDANNMTIIYDSDRKLCPLLWGTIEGAAERFQEHAEINESTCMKKGGKFCTFEVTITAIKTRNITSESQEQQKRRLWQQQLEHIVWNTLPKEFGMTIAELQVSLNDSPAFPGSPRVSVVLETLRRLQYAGLVSCTNHESLLQRRYCRIPLTSDFPEPLRV